MGSSKELDKYNYQNFENSIMSNNSPPKLKLLSFEECKSAGNGEMLFHTGPNSPKNKLGKLLFNFI